MLKQAADDGEIQLKYLDESGFCLWSPVSYSYSPVGEQKRMEQTKPIYGWRISILGLWQEHVGFEYGLAKGGFNSLSYLELMQWIAAKAAVTLAATGQITVVVQDNGSIHKSQIVQAQWDTWAAQGLIMFFLPPYCSEMNPYAFGGAKPYEGEWHQIKAHEMAGQMFDNAHDLAMAVEASVEHRYQSKAYQLERFMFNSP